MARLPRGIELDKEGRYHIRCQVAGPLEGFYPLHNPEEAAELERIIKHYTKLYYCTPTAFGLTGNHYHLPVEFEAYRKMPQEELQALAECFYPGPRRPYLEWGEEEWERFNLRVFNVSELMRNINQSFAVYYNKKYERRGSFWAGRFRSNHTDNPGETVYYVELNSVRAGLVQRPEEWRYSSAWMRKHGQDDWLMPLEKLLDISDRELAEKFYWVGLYWRGTESNKETDALIPVDMAEQMEQAMFPRGCYLKRQDCLSRGGVVGNWETVKAAIDKCNQAGIYRRERKPIPLGFGNLYSLRQPRNTCLRL
jgi:putative transposase